MELSKSSVYKFTAVNIYIFKRGDLKSLIQTSTKRNQKIRIDPNTDQAQGDKKYYCKFDREQKNNREKSTKSKAGSLKKSENFTSTDQLTRTQITKFRNERGNITSNLTKIKFINEYQEQQYANKLENCCEINKFLERCNQKKLTQEKHTQNM